MADRLRQGLLAVSKAVSAFSETTPDYDRLLVSVVRGVTEVLHDACIVVLRTDEGATVTPIAMHDESREVMADFAAVLRRPHGLADVLIAAVASGEPLFMPEVDLHVLATLAPTATLDFVTQLAVRGLIVVPLKVRSEVIGAIAMVRHRRELPMFDDIARELTEHLASHAGLAVRNSRLFKRAEISAEVSRSETRAREATMFLDAIIDNLPDMVFLKEADNLTFVRFNRAGEELLGIPRAQLIGKSDADLFPPSEAAFFVAKDRETLNGRKLVEIAEEPIQTAYGPRWLHTKKVPIVDATGEPRFLLGISHDITDRKADLAEMRAAKDAAEAANRELEAFSYSVAHDLRAPLRVIDGFAHALVEDFAPTLGEDGNRHLDRIRNAAQRMGVIIDELLNLSRVSRAPITREPVNLGELARASLGVLQRGGPAREVEIVVPERVMTSGDPKLLGIVLDNLLGNAWKFTSKRASARIELGSRVEDGRTVYFVRDNGVGFDMQYVHRLFGVFQRLHSEGEFPGTGIGLATVQRIVHRHGGRAWADGAVDIGATFHFTLDNGELLISRTGSREHVRAPGGDPAGESRG
jgi:PAS domain S-box-containing protein